MQTIARQRWLDPVDRVLGTVATRALGQDSPTPRAVRNALHGTWLQHPLHPAITDVPVGAWTAATVLDAVDTLRPTNELAAGADAAVAIGLVGAAGAAVTGLNDWQYTSRDTRRIGVLHATLNVGATLLYGASLVMRRRGARGAGRGLGLLGFALAGTSAYLGGHLVYEKRLGVDRTSGQTPPEEFVAVLPESELPERQMRRVLVHGMPILLVRFGDRIHALSETCTHMGGPLSEGELGEDRVTCPWHGSQFAFDDAGQVLRGPATFPAYCFETRVRDGQIEVRRADSCQQQPAAAVAPAAPEMAAASSPG
ncbi:MAG: Rieske (2Fe-2S) protein [Armatimonadetes bacterium]|nr:Rieske (2Fe-2S) protein [Armatimonadota bacterium]